MGNFGAFEIILMQNLCFSEGMSISPSLVSGIPRAIHLLHELLTPIMMQERVSLRVALVTCYMLCGLQTRPNPCWVHAIA